jgi:hypothetical protein
MTGPRGTTPLTKNDATCHITIRPHLPIKKLPHHHMPHQRTVVRSLPRQPVRTAQSASFFFACLTIRTDRDISRSRRPFETKRVALGSQRRGLHSRSI